MKVLSLTQPWADLVVRQLKRWETRSWLTKYTGRLYIHASKRFPLNCKRLLQEEPFLTAFNTPPDELATGAIIGGVDLIGCWPTQGVTVSSMERAFGDFGPNRFAWGMERGFRFAPIPCRGMLGLWTPSHEIAQLITERIEL